MRILGLILFLLPALAFGQELNSPVFQNGSSQLAAYFCNVDGLNEDTPDISTYIRKLEQRESPGNDLKFCKTLFYKTRKEFFHNFEQYASFRETISRGKYNCLTGTALYALLLDHFGIEYTIIETNYHIFLVAKTKEGDVLFEATDPVNGFVTNAEEIEKRIRAYQRNTLQSTEGDNKRYYAYSVNLYKDVTLTEMSGLLHYNLSIEAYNGKNIRAAIHHLDKALDLYNSPRIAEFSSILLLSVVESDLNESIKADYLRRIQAIRRKQTTLIASRD